MSQNFHIAIIGPTTIIAHFQALGVTVLPAETETETVNIIKQLKKDTATGENKSYAVILVIDYLLKNLPADEYRQLTIGSLPAILTIPALGEASEAGLDRLKDLAKRAIGSDIGNI